MQGFRSSFHTAFWALLLALAIPGVVFMFGTIRNRQLQSTANPRWAQFAKVTGWGSTNPTTDGDSRRVSVRNASIRSDETSPTPLVRHPRPETSLTGSVTGHSSIEMPVRSPSAETPVLDHDRSTADHESAHRHPKFSRSAENESESVPAVSTSRLEGQLREVRQRLDQLAQQQSEHQSNNAQLQSQFLQRETVFLDAIKNLSETSVRQQAAEQTLKFRLRASSETVEEQPRREARVEQSPVTTRPVQKATVVAEAANPAIGFSHPAPTEEVFKNPVTASLNAAVEVPSYPSPAKSASLEEFVRISRKLGSDHSEVYTMEVHDADVRQFFEKLSEVAGVSILPGPEVTGLISLTLREVPFEAALKAIAKIRGYVVEREGDIVVICTADEALRLKHQNRRLLRKFD